MNYLTMWQDFKALPWWKKVLLFVPIVILVVLLFVKNSLIKDLLKASKSKTDKKVESFYEDYEHMKEEQKEIDQKRKDIKERYDNVLNNFGDIIKRIDSADDTELDIIADELRQRAKTRPRTAGRD